MTGVRRALEIWAWRGLSSLVLWFLLFFAVLPAWKEYAWADCGLIPSDYPVYAGDKLEVKKNVKVNGNGVAEGEYKNDKAIDGSSGNIVDWSPALPDLVPPSFPANSSAVDVVLHSNDALSTGAYRNVEVAKNSTGVTFDGDANITKLTIKENSNVVFSPGTYFINELKAEKNVNISVATPGEVKIYIGNSFEIGDNSHVNDSGNVTNFQVYLYGGPPKVKAKLKKNVNFTGFIFSPFKDTEIEIKKNSYIHGALLTAGKVELGEKGGNVQIIYTAADQTAIGGISTCPGPPSALTPIADYHFDECSWSGTPGEVVDSSGNGYNGTSVNATIIETPDILCNHGDFRGHGYITLSPKVPVGSSWTMAMWLKFPLDSTGHTDIPLGHPYGRIYPYVVASLSSTGDLAFFAERVSDGAMFWGVYDNSGGWRPLEPLPSLSSGWHHLTFVASGGWTRLYIDGSYHSRVHRVTHGDVYYLLTSSDYTPQETIGGEADEVLFFNKALSPSQVQAIYNNQSSGANWDGSSRACPSCGSTVDHYEVWHDSTALTCNPTTITVKACANAACDATASADSVELASSSTSSSWAVNPQAVNGTQSYSLSNSANETLTLSISSATPSADYCCVINGSGAANCTAGDYSDCGITFYKSGFILDQVNATSCEYGHGTVRAVRTDDTTQTCVPAFQNQSRKLLFWAQYDSPGSGTKQVSVNGTMVGPPASSAANVTLAFDSTGSAPFSVHYADAGRLWLGVNGTGNYTFMHGGGYLVFKPAKFSITSSMTNTALTGTPSLQAGRDFSLSLIAKCDNGTVTANYEDNATLWIEMANPSGASGGALQFLGKSYAVGAAGQNVTFSNGVASASNATFSDVGVFKIHVKDDDYFGQQVPEANETVGRFYPDHFKLKSSSITPGCGTFTYMEQPFTVSFVLRAEDYANSTTVNYDTALLGASITAEVGLYAEDADSGTSITSRVSPAVSGNWTSGSFTFSGNFTFARQASPDGPYQVNIGVNATDQDSVPIQGADMDCSGSSCEARLLDNNPQEFRYGHLDIYSNYGPETDNLTMGVAAVYWDGAGWSLNTADSCTSLNATDFVFSNWQDNLDPGETAVSTGSVNGIGAGEGNFTLTAPGTGNWGSVDIGLNSTSSFYQWLSGGLNGTAFFGLYRGNDKVIHWFELR